ncbi:MAG TPA: restriction endonuclease [Polyangiaceae bacterium]|nr:restriction endonuclease [Polyangiaceae bacterium]
MIVLVVALAPLLLGFVLIALIARYSPNVPRQAARATGQLADDRPPITPDEFEDIVKELLLSLGLEIVFSSAGTGGVLELICRDPRPLSGGRLLVYASPLVAAGQIDAAEVLGFADSVRGDMGALKGIFIAAAGFTDEAQAAVRSTPAQVELIDGQKLVELVRTHLPQRADLLESYHSFSREGRRHPRANREGSDDDPETAKGLAGD